MQHEQVDSGQTTFTAACFNTSGTRVGVCCTASNVGADDSKNGRSSETSTARPGFSIYQLPSPSLLNNSSMASSSAPNSSIASRGSTGAPKASREGTSSSVSAIESFLVQPVLPTETKLGGVKICALLHNHPIVVIVPSATDRVLQLFDLKTSKVLAEVQFDSTILNVMINTKRLVVVGERTMHLFDWTQDGMPCITQKHPIQTFSPVNTKGLASLSEVHPETHSCYLAFPQSSVTATTAGTAVTGSSKGEVFLVDATNAHQLGSLLAHSGPIQALRFTPNGSMLATASDKGTIIRVFATPSKEVLYSFRRGRFQTTIYDLRFSFDMQLLAATASSGSVHIFKLGLAGGSFAANVFTGAIGAMRGAAAAVAGQGAGQQPLEDGEDDLATDDATTVGGTERAIVKLTLPPGHQSAQCIIDPGNTCITLLTLVSARKKQKDLKESAGSSGMTAESHQPDTVTPVVATYRLGRDLKIDLVKQYPLPQQQ